MSLSRARIGEDAVVTWNDSDERLEGTSLAAQVAAVQARIAAAAQRAGRDPREVCLIAVSKTHPVARVQQVVAAGVRHCGENRVQEAEAKITALSGQAHAPQWHLIGHLQRNKARRAAVLFDYIHSLDSVALAHALNRARAEQPDLPPLPVLLQVNVSGEASKSGFPLTGGVAAPQLPAFHAAVAEIGQLPHLAVQGLMTIAPYSPDPEQARPIFRQVGLLREHLREAFPQLAWAQLSMGMSDDFEVAITEGATMVRVGRAIFGERS